MSSNSGKGKANGKDPQRTGGGGSGRGRGTGRGKSKATEPPPPTKKEIEQQQQELLEKQKRDAAERAKQLATEQKTEPLERRFRVVKHSSQLADDNIEKVPELSPRWLDKRLVFLPFLPQDNEVFDPSGRSLKTGQDVIELMNYNLGRLLSHRAGVFWSHVLNDKSLIKFLDSYLRYCTRGFDLDNLLGVAAGTYISPLHPNASEHSRKLYQRVFRVLVRISNHKESETDFLSPSYHSEVIYKLFDIPKLLDICALYDRSNKQAVKTLITQLFSAQPKFRQDLEVAASKISETLTALRLRIAHAKKTQELSDILLFIQDTAVTLLLFIDCYPSAATAFSSSHTARATETVHSVSESDKSTPAATTTAAHSLLESLVIFYESLLPYIEHVAATPTFASLSTSAQTAKTIPPLVTICRRLVLTLGYAIIHRGYLTPLLLSPTFPSDLKQRQEQLAALLNSLPDISSRHYQEHANKASGGTHHSHHAEPEPQLGAFLRDVDNQYNLRSAVKQLKERKHIDDAVADYVAMVLSQLAGEQPLPAAAAKSNARNAAAAVSTTSTSSPSSKPAMDEVQLASLISSVKDILSDLGDGFIERCLAFYGYNSESVINHILEGTLDPSLAKLDRTMPRGAAVTAPTPAAAASATNAAAGPSTSSTASLLATRRNVYDNDEFDILANERIDTTKIIFPRVRGGIAVDTAADEDGWSFLNDKSFVRSQKDKYLAYLEYDDEYDDSIEEFSAIGNLDGEGFDQQRRTKPTTKRVEGKSTADGEDEGGESSEYEEDENDQDEEDEQEHKPQLEREDNTQRSGGRGRGAGGRGGSSGEEAKGRGRGRGSGDTEEARRVKHRNKAHYGNHNRKDRAARKKRLF